MDGSSLALPSGKRLHHYGKSALLKGEDPPFLWPFSTAKCQFASTTVASSPGDPRKIRFELHFVAEEMTDKHKLQRNWALSSGGGSASERLGVFILTKWGAVWSYLEVPNHLIDIFNN